MKLKNIFILSITLIFLSSCSDEYKMKKNFKEAYSGIMKDPDSYELISFKIFQEPYEYSEENQWFIHNFKSLEKHKHRDLFEVQDSIRNLEEKLNPKFLYTGALVKIKGTNSYGAKVTSEHIAYYVAKTLVEVDGYMVSIGSNEIMTWLKKTN